jgi:hypothetical protein
MATINIRALWGGALDSDSDSESDASILGELKDDAVYEDDSDYDFDRLPQKSEMNPAKLNMEHDLVSIGSSSDDEFHVPTAKDYRRTRDFDMTDAVSYDSDSSYEVLAEKKSFPKMAGLRGDEFENYIATDEYNGKEEEENINMNDADVDLIEFEYIEDEQNNFAGDEQNDKLSKLREELKGLSGIKVKGKELAKAKETVEEALDRAMAGVSGAVEGRRTKEKLRSAVGKLRGNARASKEAKAEAELRETLEELEEDEAEEHEDGGYRTPTAEDLARDERRALTKAGSREEEVIEEDIEEDEYDDSVSFLGGDPLSVYSVGGRPLPTPLKREVQKVFADPQVVRNYKAIVRQVGSKKGDILKFLQQNDEWIAEADTHKNWTKNLLEAELKMFVADRLETGQEVVFEGRVRGIPAEEVRSPAVQKVYRQLRKEGLTTKDKKTAFIQSLGIPFNPRGLSLSEVDAEFQKAIALRLRRESGGGGGGGGGLVASRVAQIEGKLKGDNK